VNIEKLVQEVEARRDLPPPRMRKAIRQGAGVSRARLGDVVGVSEASIGFYEAGTRNPSGEHLCLYAEALESLRNAAGL
jgi:transcriptional regulator with XRE-family HTH domain